MRVYNTMSNQKQELVPLEAGKIKMYACGPTVYNFIHIGNARPICVFDTMRRYLEYKGYDVTFVQNFTDVDDKIINKAADEGTSSTEVAERFMKEYNTDADGLGVRPPNIAPKATETMPEIIAIVNELVEKGHAYAVDGDVYFRSRSFGEYGKLSHQPLDDLESGARIGISEQKEDPLDFALWKSAKPGEPSWTSPWGEGRPGWHIECSAMVKKHLGKTIDIHCGGQDLIFPHHENEIAQSECANHAPFATYWMHNGYINVDNRKMSKSLGNFFTVRDVAEKYGYEPIKFMMLQAHYRSPLSYSAEVLEQCKAALERIHTCRDNLDFLRENAEASASAPNAALTEMLAARRTQFEEALDDDLNTADAIAAIFDLVRDLNIYFAQEKPLADVDAAIALFDKLCAVLGLLYSRENKNDADAEILAMIEERQQARKGRDFARADAIRDELLARGVELKDTPQGVQYSIAGK